MDLILAVIAVEGVPVPMAVNKVTAATAEDLVDPVAAIERVPAGAALDDVIAVFAPAS